MGENIFPKRALLIELLDLALPPETISRQASGVEQFSARYGFREKPLRIRFRQWDTNLSILPNLPGLPDISLDAASFAALKLPLKKVYISENETNFLAFPPVDQAIVIFGAGYGWDALSQAAWLAHCEVYYWGDIDTHGFAILDQLRSYFPHVQSVLMDRDTLLQHRAHWTVETTSTHKVLPRLTASESEWYGELCEGRLQVNVCLEQERLGFDWVMKAIYS